MSLGRLRYSPRPEAGPMASMASGPAARRASEMLTRVLFVAPVGKVPWHRISMSLAVTVLLTGIGLSCVVAQVLDGHPVIFTVP